MVVRGIRQAEGHAKRGQDFLAANTLIGAVVAAAAMPRRATAEPKQTLRSRRGNNTIKLRLGLLPGQIRQPLFSDILRGSSLKSLRF